MNSNDLFDIIGETPEWYVLDAANVHTKVISTGKRSPKRVWLIAAIIAAMVFLMGCAVVYILSLDQMILGTDYVEDQPGVTEPRTRLSLQGYVGSPSYQAAKEWYDFLQSYDQDNAIRFSEEAYSVEFSEDYQNYNLYTVAMKDKLDEICQKYDLELLGPILVDTSAENMFRELGIPGVLREDAQAEVIWSEGGPGYFFRDGTFEVEFAVTLTGENNPWPYENVVFFRCHNKKAFDDVTMVMKDPDSFAEWSYITSQGVEVLLIQGPEGAMIVADIGDYFITVGGIETKAGNILDGETTMTREGLEAYAEIFDFSITPQRLTQEQITAVRSRYDTHWAEIEADLQVQEEQFQEYLGRASYEARVKFHLENDTEAVRMGYTFYDFDNNGVKELVIGRDGYIEYIYTEKGGETEAILGWPMMGQRDAYLAEDGTLVCAGEYSYHFFYVEDGKAVTDYWVEYRDYLEDPWWLCYPTGEGQTITEKEYNAHKQSKKRVVLEMLPLTQYPLTEPASYHTDGKDITYYNTKTTYSDMIRERILNPVEKAPGVYYECTYALLDLDGDGQEELILDEGYFRGVYTTNDGKAIPMYSGTTFTCTGLNICKGNIIEVVHTYSGDNKVYCYYRMSGTKGEMVEYLRYDAERNPLNPWFRSSDATGQDISLEPITKAEFENIQEIYAPIELDWKPITEYPLN